MEENRMVRGTRILEWISFLAAIAAFSWTFACERTSPTDPNPFTATEAGTEAGAQSFVPGVTSGVEFTTIPPNTAPPRAPTIHANLLAFDQECPACTLVTPRGSALVWINTGIFAETPEGNVPLTFEELNAWLQPGLPVKIRVDGLENTRPVAQDLFLARNFSATGSVDRSRGAVISDRELVVTVVDEATGPVQFHYVLDEGATVGSFEAGDRVLVMGVSKEGSLIAQSVTKDE